MDILSFARLSVTNLLLLVTSWLVSGFWAIFLAVAILLFNIVAEADFISAIFEVTAPLLFTLAVDLRL